MSDKIRASAYVIVQADVLASGKVRGAKITGTRQNRPDLRWNEIAVRVHLDLPAAIFARITPEAVIDVPDDIVVHPVVVATTTPAEGLTA